MLYPRDPAGFRFVREKLSGARVYVRAGDLIPASKEGDRAGIESRPEWTPVAMSNLSSNREVPWIWDGFIAEGSTTLLVGLYKAGKTTLLAHLLKAMESGGEVACPVVGGRALVVSEEGVTLWAKRRDLSDPTDPVHATTEQQLAEVAAILAVGVIRMRERRRYAAASPLHFCL